MINISWLPRYSRRPSLLYSTVFCTWNGWTIRCPFLRDSESKTYFLKPHLEVGRILLSNCQAKLRTLVWAVHDFPSRLPECHSLLYLHSGGTYLGYQVFYVTFKILHCFLMLLVSCSLTVSQERSHNYTLSTQLPSILFNIRDNLQVARDERERPIS